MSEPAAVAELEPDEEEIPPQEADDETGEDPSVILERLVSEHNADERQNGLLSPFVLAVKEWTAGQTSADQLSSILKGIETSLPTHENEAYQAIQTDVVERLYAAIATGQLNELIYPLLQLSRDLEDNHEE